MKQEDLNDLRDKNPSWEVKAQYPDRQANHAGDQDSDRRKREAAKEADNDTR